MSGDHVEIKDPAEVMRLINRGIDGRERLLREAAEMGCAGNVKLAEAFGAMKAEAAALAARVDELERQVAALAESLCRHQGA